MKIQILDYGCFKCREKWHPAFNATALHTIYYPLGGTAYYELNGENFKFEKNNIYIFPTFSLCTGFHDPNDPFDVLWFQLSVSPFLDGDVYKIDASSGFYRDIMQSLLSSINKDLDILEPLLQGFLSSCIYDNLVKVCEDDKISFIIDYINLHINSDLNNDVLSKLLSYNKNYFIAFFKKHTGMSPRQYIKSARLNQAKFYLKKGVSVTEVADLCGFSSANTLSRDIKNFFGVTPSELKSFDL